MKINPLYDPLEIYPNEVKYESEGIIWTPRIAETELPILKTCLETTDQYP